MPRVSVVIPCYNAHRYLTEVLASVRAQSFGDYEIIVVDDGSTDPATAAFLESIGGGVRLVRKPNGGLSSARNAGFAAARGTYVLPLDADDEIAPDMLALTVAALDASPDAGYAYAQIEVFGDERGVVRKTWNLFEQLATNQLPYCLLMRRTVWTQAGGYDETMREGYEDWEFNIRISKLGVRGIQVESPLFRYRRQSTGMLQSVSQRRHAALWRRIRAKHADIYSFGALLDLWRRWRGHPSTHPLALVWGLLLATAVLPDAAFNRLFLALHRLGATSRAAAGMQAGTGRV
ncbi:MAG: glycosyltransferase family 2 protein [Rhodospirillales bacterium]|nr:glycosyltransferase family 2 protein [Rhodospirillales bacterium]